METSATPSTLPRGAAGQRLSPKIAARFPSCNNGKGERDEACATQTPVADAEAKAIFLHPSDRYPTTPEQLCHYLEKNFLKTPLHLLEEYCEKHGLKGGPIFEQVEVERPPLFGVRVTVDGLATYACGASLDDAKQLAAQQAINCLLVPRYHGGSVQIPRLFDRGAASESQTLKPTTIVEETFDENPEQALYLITCQREWPRPLYDTHAWSWGTFSTTVEVGALSVEATGKTDLESRRQAAETMLKTIQTVPENYENCGPANSRQSYLGPPRIAMGTPSPVYTDRFGRKEAVGTSALTCGRNIVTIPSLVTPTHRGIQISLTDISVATKTTAMDILNKLSHENQFQIHYYFYQEKMAPEALSCGCLISLQTNPVIVCQGLAENWQEAQGRAALATLRLLGLSCEDDYENVEVD